MQQPTRQMLRKTLMNRRKKKPSRQPWFSNVESGVLKRGFIQSNQPLGSADIVALERTALANNVGSKVLRSGRTRDNVELERFEGHRLGALGVAGR